MNKSNPILFSIVVCTYNREKHIRQCLDSLVNLDFPKDSYEIIVVDDGSTDNTVKIVEKYPVKLIAHGKNKGLSVARNSGLYAAKGDIYVCFDDDCYVAKDWLKNLAKGYEGKNKTYVAGIGGVIKTFKNTDLIGKYMADSGYGNPSPVHYTQNKNIFSRFYSYIRNMFFPSIQTNENIFTVGEIWGANCSFPIEVLKAMSGWDENLSGVEDTDLCNRIKKKFPEKKFFCVKNAVLYHDHRLSLKNFLLKPYRRGNAIYKFYRKNNKIPPIFPFPLAILGITGILTVINPFLFFPSLLVLPQAFYSWWILRAIQRRTWFPLIFPYLQSGYELSTILGLCKGALKNFRLITTRKILLLALLFGSATNYLVIKNIDLYYAREIMSSLFLLLMPGFLLSIAVKIMYKSVWEFVSYIIGLSIALLMLLGLGINYVLPLITIPAFHILSIAAPAMHITKPLEFWPILISIDIFLGILWIYSFIMNHPLPMRKNRLGLSIKSVILSIITTCFPILSAIGAFSLNNNSTNTFTMTMLGSIAAFVLVLLVMRDKVSKHLFPYSIFMIALSILLMTSLRGWYITGHDIFLETYVFQLTKSYGLWSMSFFHDPYTACLSITILPTIIANITHINDFYIYKILYQAFFATSVITTYLFIKKFLHPYLAFLGSFIIISLPTFMTDMPMLNRQETALIFFVLLLHLLFTNEFSKKIKWFLFIFFGLGLLLSHYSTTYIAVSLFIGAYLLHLPLRFITIHPRAKSLMKSIYAKVGLMDSKPNLHIGMVIILLIAAVVWNVNITNTSSGITITINNIVKDLQTLRFAKAKSDPGSYGLLNNKAPSNSSLLANYVITEKQFVRKFNDDSAFLDKSIYSKYPVSIGGETKDNLTNIGEYLQKNLHINVFTLNDQLKQYYAKIIQVFIVIGFVAIFFFKKHIRNFEKEYLILTITFFGILVLQTILPGGSIDYGILRLFQQGMVLLSIPLIMGGLAVFSIFNFLHKDIKIYLISFVFIFFFLYLSGFIPQITGGYYSQLNVANSGFYYDAYYTHTQDLASMDWLSINRDIKTPVQSDWFALNKIHTYENFYSIDGLIPSVIRVNSYVLLTTINTQTKQVIIYANGAPLYYTYNFDVLNQNKNLIYSNGDAKIYR